MTRKEELEKKLLKYPTGLVQICGHCDGKELTEAADHGMIRAVDCYHCRDKGLVMTKQGEKMLAFLSDFMIIKARVGTGDLISEISKHERDM